MNTYIDAQCKNIVTMVEMFEQACKMGALKDDGQISKDEAKALKKISAAVARFKADLNSLK